MLQVLVLHLHHLCLGELFFQIHHLLLPKEYRLFYLMVLKPAFYPVRERFYGRLREARLSQAALEVLSLVAYKQPLTVERINELRRTSSGSILNQLVRRQLLRMERPADDAKTRLYYTTPRFLQLFGLESLSDLPEAHDLDQM